MHSVNGLSQQRLLGCTACVRISKRSEKRKGKGYWVVLDNAGCSWAAKRQCPELVPHLSAEMRGLVSHRALYYAQGARSEESVHLWWTSQLCEAPRQRGQFDEVAGPRGPAVVNIVTRAKRNPNEDDVADNSLTHTWHVWEFWARGWPFDYERILQTVYVHELRISAPFYRSWLH